MIEASAANGVQIVHETIPFFRSVSFGVWVIAGSRDETEEKSGLFHFLEHLAFKGTPTRDAGAIAVEIDALGGHIDAFTSREVTCFSGHVLAERLDRAFELVADLMLNSNFPEDEIERERRVILEEIRMGEDNPSDYIHDSLYPLIWGGHSLGRPITGVVDSVNAITRDDLVAARDKFYRPSRIVVTACGGVEAGRVVELVEKYFGHLEPLAVDRSPGAPERKAASQIIRKPLEQAHVLLAGPGLPADDPARHDLAALNMILGGGVSSRLFQKVREEQGLAYSIYSFYDQYTDAGLFGVYAACAPDALERLWETLQGEIKSIVSAPPTEGETARAKAMGEDNLKMSFESLNSRMYQMAQQKIYHGKTKTFDEMMAELNAVTAKRVLELAERILGGTDFTILALGPLNAEQERLLKSRWLTGHPA